MDINLITPINTLSYGYVGTHILDELMKLGHNVALFPINPQTMECHPRHHANIQKAWESAKFFDVNAPCIRIWHQNDMSQFVGKGLHVGFPIFELDTFDDLEKHHLRSCDQLFVCSTWGREIVNGNLGALMENNNFCKVVPLGVDTDVFIPKMSKRKPTIFLNVGKWETRKGHDILISAFEEAFTSDDNVELWMMNDNQFPHAQKAVEKFVRRYKHGSLSDKVRLLPRVETDAQVADIMREADCGVFPSRAEGWNLEALEMLSCGKQVIVTDYSAHREFCGANSWLLPIRDLEPAIDDVWFDGKGNWAKIDDYAIDMLVSHMREIHKLKQNGELEINEFGIKTAETFSWRNTASTIIECLS